MKLLLIEDERETAEYIVHGLQCRGYIVDHLSNGREAFVRATCEACDLMIVDRRVPGMDGRALVRAMRGADVRTPV